MEEHLEGVAFPSTQSGAAEERMLREDLVREVAARRERGESTRRIARELGVDRKTIRRWLRIGGWRPRQNGERRRAIDAFVTFIDRRGPEVGWNGVVLHRELAALGFTGCYQQVPRWLKPRRLQRRWQEAATIRFETGPGEQAQVDYGQLQVWIGEQPQTVHLFVFTLGYSRRLFTHGYRNERLATLLDGHERAFRWFGGVTLTCLYDNPRTLVLGRSENKVMWHPLFEDFARYYGFSPHACQPYRPRTKGKVESGVKYVKRNALAGRRFASWEELNSWLERWSVEVADLRIHGTTHERPIDRFACERLTPLGGRPPYRYERVRLRRVGYRRPGGGRGGTLLGTGGVRRTDGGRAGELRSDRVFPSGQAGRPSSQGRPARRGNGSHALRRAVASRRSRPARSAALRPPLRTTR